jgi:NADH:ubiquinone reductase (H+-translocating)
LITQDLSKVFPDLMLHYKITILEASHHILSSFDKKLQEYALKNFKRQRITIQMDTIVKEIKNDCVILNDGSKIDCKFILWSAGIFFFT